jgi:hypothetical protein
MANDARRVPLTGKVEPELRAHAQKRAKAKGVSVSEFVRGLVVSDREAVIDPSNMKHDPAVPVDSKPAAVPVKKLVSRHPTVSRLKASAPAKKATKAVRGRTAVTKVGPVPQDSTRRPFCPHPINRVRDGICGRCGGRA